MDTAAGHGLRLMGDVRWHAGDTLWPFKPERRYQLLALLACRRDWVARPQLAEQMWPDHPNAAALRNLRKVVMQACKLAATLPQAPAVDLEGDRLRWRVPSDLVDFVQACDAGQHGRAAQAYRPGLLDGLEGGLGEPALDWVARQRAWLEQRWHEAVQHWFDSLEEHPAALASAAEEVLARDPLHEATLRALLRACQALGEPARAQRALQLHGQRLQQELGAMPAPDLALAAVAPLAPAPAPMRGIAPAAVQKIIEAAMDVVADHRQWPALLQHLTEATHGFGTLLAGCSFTRPQDGLLLTHGLDLALGRRFLESYQDNPWSRAMMSVPMGRAVDQMLLVPRRLVEGTPFHEEIIRPQAIRHTAVMGMPMGHLYASGGISINFGGHHARAQSEQAQRLLEQLAPYLQRATAALMRWQVRSHTAAACADLQPVASAVLILDANARLLFANAPAEALLSRSDGLRLQQGQLVASHPAEVPLLDALVRQAARAEHQPLTTLGADLRLRLRGVPGVLRVSVAPLRAHGGPPGVPARAAVMVLAEPQG